MVPWPGCSRQSQFLQDPAAGHIFLPVMASGTLRLDFGLIRPGTCHSGAMWDRDEKRTHPSTFAGQPTKTRSRSSTSSPVPPWILRQPARPPQNDNRLFLGSYVHRASCPVSRASPLHGRSGSPRGRRPHGYSRHLGQNGYPRDHSLHVPTSWWPRPRRHRPRRPVSFLSSWHVQRDHHRHRLKPFFVYIDVRFFRHRPRSRDQQARDCHPLHRATESERQSTSFVFHGGSWWEAWWSRWDNKLSHNAGTLRSTLPFSSILASRHPCSSLFSRFLMDVLLFSFFPHSLRFLSLRVFTHSCLGSVVAQTLFDLSPSLFSFLYLSFLPVCCTHLRPGSVVTPARALSNPYTFNLRTCSTH